MSKVLITAKVVGNFFEEFSRYLSKMDRLVEFEEEGSMWIWHLDTTLTRTGNAAIRIEVGENPHTGGNGVIYNVVKVVENVYEMTYVGERADYGRGEIRALLGSMKVSNQVSVQKIENEIFDFNSNLHDPNL